MSELQIAALALLHRYSPSSARAVSAYRCSDFQTDLQNRTSVHTGDLIYIFREGRALETLNIAQQESICAICR